MISDYEDLQLDIRKSDGEKGAVVGYSSRNSKLNKDSQYEAELYSENYLFIFKPLTKYMMTQYSYNIIFRKHILIGEFCKTFYFISNTYFIIYTVILCTFTIYKLVHIYDRRSFLEWTEAK